MSIRFKWLWVYWMGWLFYDFFATYIGIFPDRTLKMRLSEDASIAFFIVGAWFVAWVRRRSP